MNTKKQILRGIIIGLIFAAIVIGGTFFLLQSREKSIEKLAEEFTLEELINTAEEEVRLSCIKMVNKLKDVGKCEEFKKLADQDVCYYCFAIINSNEDLCGKIASDSPWKEKCQKEFILEMKIEEMKWSTYQGNGYKIDYPPYFDILGESREPYLNSVTFSLNELAEQAGFHQRNLSLFESERVVITVYVGKALKGRDPISYFPGAYENIKPTEINGRIFHRGENWHSYEAIKEVTVRYVLPNKDKSRFAKILFTAHGISKEDISQRLEFAEQILFTFQFLE